MSEEFNDIGFGGEDRAPFASFPARSRGRLLEEAESPTRTPFQRDRDRIIHSTAFRRLKHKTQVFFAHDQDHFRTRLTHTIEVAQIARSLARALRLDDDLAEAVALVHDFGHTPFGHTGEDVLDELMTDYGGFEHNAQSLRIVTRLERRYAEFDGLNLTWETLEGLIKHNGPLISPTSGGGNAKEPVPVSILKYNALHDLELDRHASLEAQVAAIADDIAYNTHDLDDGVRSGLLTLDMMKDVPMAGAALQEVDDLYPGLDNERRVHEMTRRVMTRMVEDVIASTLSSLNEVEPYSVDDVHAAGRTLVAFSPMMASQEKSLKSFLFSNLYRHESVLELRKRAEAVVQDLFSYFIARPKDMSVAWATQVDRLEEPERARLVADYLAGMTDSFALKEHRRLFDHTPDLG
ncbi:MAG: deoxyguanosinetriphosphate triphosphohydrolase [Pseudomonadota bacterium]